LERWWSVYPNIYKKTPPGGPSKSHLVVQADVSDRTTTLLLIAFVHSLVIVLIRSWPTIWSLAVSSEKIKLEKKRLKATTKHRQF